MRQVVLPATGTDRAWRDAARALLAARIPPAEVSWHHGTDAPSLFEDDAAPLPPPGAATVRVPAAFVSLAESVVWHRDPERFARLYALLWRLRLEKRLMEDQGDADLVRLRRMEKAVHRCRHKMRAFVRFREIGARDAPRRRFAAWFEPTHLTLEPNTGFFARRFADMDWAIATPDLTAVFEAGAVRLEPGQPRPDLPEDATEALWTTYFRNIFNPARVKIGAMTSEMPRKYWKNMPETRAIPDLLATAEARVREMQAAAPTLPPLRAERIAAGLHRREQPDAPRVSPIMTYDDLRRRAEEESREAKPGYGRVVLGEGPLDAGLMIVGEQPGDMEDREGRPFVGPAGQLFDRIAAEAGLDRGAAYVTNAVKQFKFRQLGKRRLHQTPTGQDIEHARWWLNQEIALVAPKLILAMGGTAAETLTGSRAGILKRRGSVEETKNGPVFLTVHPSYILRLPDADAKAAETDRFSADLASARARLDTLRAA